ncbi:MAG: aminodeoxychorismate synthase component I [Melioribacteraceae bacterium]|nr:aminodeoxychorismate synthase component I [Melioribacteraceae bacterium]
MDIISLIKFVIDNPGSALFYSPPIKEDQKTLLLKSPSESIEIKILSEIRQSFKSLDELKNRFNFCYGYVTYEAGYAFEERLFNLIDDKNDSPFLKFYCTNDFNEFESNEIDHSSAIDLLKESNWQIDDLHFDIDESTYKESIKKIKNYIEQGDTYQVNFTFKANFDVKNNLVALITGLIYNQSAKYTSILNCGNKLIVSISPELFFKIENGDISSRPMKGTISRGKNFAEDIIYSNTLYNSEKDRAENTMIVDLLRNDLGRICRTGSVKVIEPHKIEKYESVYQMTSGVTGELATNNLCDIFEAIFPCGSITGAPKLRTMEIIHELESSRRGIYTGAIGFLSDEKTVFNIPIRTLEIELKTYKGEIGIGSGIIWDSKEDEEWKESILKSNFLTKSSEYFEIFESMLIEENSIELIDYHLDRLRKTADHFLFIFNRQKLLDRINDDIKNLSREKRFKYKLLLSKWGECKSEITEIEDSNDDLKIIVSETRTSPKENYFYFKTTQRKLYDEEYKKAVADGFDEVIFFNNRDELTEGSISNIVLSLGDDFFTPPVDCGLLAGNYRKLMIDQNNLKEKVLTIEHLLNADEMYVINAVRKRRKVSEIFYKGKIIKTFSKSR